MQPGLHPSTLTSINNLAALLGRQGRFDEAEALMREALAGLQALLGAAHAHTQSTAASLEGLLRNKAAAARAPRAPRA